jgi:hypothetical protein
MSKESPPQTSRKCDDDHDRADVGAHLNPPPSRMQWIQTRRRTTRPTGGPHAAEVWPATHHKWLQLGCSASSKRPAGARDPRAARTHRSGLGEPRSG